MFEANRATTGRLCEQQAGSTRVAFWEVLMPHFGRAVGLAAAILSVALFGCAAPGSDPPAGPSATVAPYPPPPDRAEIPPRAPSTDALWLGGHWTWNGTKYAWIAGHYTARPTPTANWLPGYWQQEPGGWQWVHGHWES
jgi:hypothetical protein